MLLGGTIPPDNIEVEDVPGGGGAFVVTFEVLHFHKRMVVSKQVGLEFIARSECCTFFSFWFLKIHGVDRMWRLEFLIVPETGLDHYRPGSWCIALSLLETSPPTWIDSRLIIPEATSPPSDKHSDHGNTPVSASSRFKLPSNASKAKPIELRLQAKRQLETSRKGLPSNRILAMLQDSLMGANLQYG